MNKGYYVYRWMDRNNEVLYVGKTNNIRSRTNNHINSQEWMDETHSVYYARCQTETDMDLYEIYYINKLKPKYNKNYMNNDEFSFELPELNFEKLIVEINIKNKNNKIDLENYNKIFINKNIYNILTDMKLDKNEKLVFYVLRDFVQHPTNCVMINGEIPKFSDLEPILSLTERTIRDALKSLDVKGVIKLVQCGHRKAIYINPQYYATGKELNIETLMLFGLVECDDDKVESYIQ